jgi:AcrR family transcriptional regulator
VQRRKAWNGSPPRTQAEARRSLLDAARDCVERVGLSKASLSEVAETAGVTRQTVYRYFEDADDLFRSAAVLASGGFRERLRRRVLARGSLAERMVETLVLSIREIPEDPHLSALAKSGEHFTVSSVLRLRFVQEEMVALAEGHLSLTESERDELSEILLRLLHSFLADPGEVRTEAELRALLYRWLVPVIQEKLEVGSRIVRTRRSR